MNDKPTLLDFFYFLTGVIVGTVCVFLVSAVVGAGVALGVRLVEMAGL